MPASTASLTGDIMSLTLVDGGISPVPVPAALPLFLSGLAVLGVVGRKRAKRAG